MIAATATPVLVLRGSSFSLSGFAARVAVSPSRASVSTPIAMAKT